MRDWINKLYFRYGEIVNVYLYTIILFILMYFLTTVFKQQPLATNTTNTLWGGSCPIEVYQVFDKETGVYYAVTERGGICPMYTIEGEVKLVDQGNEYVTHKNLGEPNAQE